MNPFDSGALYGFAAIARKEFMHIMRDPTTIIFALFTPLMQLIFFGFALNYDVRYVPTVVVDQDRTRESREYLAKLGNTHYLEIVGAKATPGEAADAIRSGVARVAVVIPPNFARQYGSKRPPQVQAIIDGSDSQVATPAVQAFRATASRAPGEVEVRQRVLFNPNSKTSTYTIPGLIGVILQMGTVTLTAFSLVKERESGSLDQLMVTPVGRMGLVLGKILPYAVLSSVEFIGVLWAATIIFDVPLRGNFFALSALSVLFIFCGLSLGLLISTIAKTQGQALQFAMLTILPSILLSGYLAPLETLPGALTLISNVIPARHYIEISRGIMVRGATLGELWVPSVALLALTAGLLLIATARFRKTIS